MFKARSPPDSDIPSFMDSHCVETRDFWIRFYIVEATDIIFQKIGIVNTVSESKELLEISGIVRA